MFNGSQNNILMEVNPRDYGYPVNPVDAKYFIGDIKSIYNLNHSLLPRIQMT